MTDTPFGPSTADLNKGPLDEDELDRLESLFYQRRDFLDAVYEKGGDAAFEGRDPGLVSVPELDGFLTAIVSSPQVVPPSLWLPVVLGDFEDPLAEQTADILGLIMRLSNSIVSCLMDSPDDFDPLVHDVLTEDGRSGLWLTPWCDGYLRAITLTADDWEEADDLIGDAVETIASLSSLFDEDEAPQDFQDQHDLLPAVTQAARHIHHTLLAARSHLAPTATATAGPARRDTPRVGRNAPCPCGSGKKYKHCCLH